MATPAPGQRLGPYEIVEAVGAGGMGEVWKARDTRLDRIVAIKVSKDQFSERFDREARAVAALNHPHICQLYDVGPNYLVMEFIEGAPLAGPLPIAKAVEYAVQILDALDAAHRKGITHRDLKPANILVTKQGIKLLDFGLAKQNVPLKHDDATVTRALTSQGQIVGTLQYMAPEQLQGKETDARSDLFAFGCVLYEMLTGKRAFGGESAASVIAAILEREPEPLSAAPPLERVVRRALAKDPDQRFQTARDLKAALTWAMEHAPPAPAAKSGRRWWWIAAAFLTGGIATLVWMAPVFRQPAGEEHAMHFHLNPPAGAHFLVGVGGGFAISPDGRTIAFVAVSNVPKLWLRRLESLTAIELPGTEGAEFPFWSPDNRSLGFFAGGKLKRIEISGGPPVFIADAPSARGGSWSSQGKIVFGSLSGLGELKVVAASGGTPASLIRSHSEGGDVLTLLWPRFLPDGRRFLYAVRASGKGDLSGIYLSSLDRPQQSVRLTRDLSAAAYVPPRGKSPGYLLWVRVSTLMAQPFDPENARLSGEALAVPGAETVSTTGFANFGPLSASNEGKVVVSAGDDRYQLTWFSRDGKVLGTVGQPDRYAALRISPDASRAAVSILDSAGKRDIWQLEFARGIQNRVTVSGAGFVAVWSPDGQRLAYHLASGPILFERSASGAGDQETILQGKGAVFINDWSPDGRYILYTQSSPDTQYDLWLLPKSGDPNPVPFLKTSFNESHGQFSPDGKWIAYTSDEPGQSEIFVQSRTAGEFKAQVSNGGASFARWRGDGKELFYRALDGNLMVVSVRATAHGLELGAPVALLRLVESMGTFAYPYDVTPDGQRILTLVPAGGTGTVSPLILLVNWEAGLKR